DVNNDGHITGADQQLWTIHTSGNLIQTSGTLNAGSYLAEIKGTATGTSPSYAAAVTLAPVPEPGEWAMILAGLGMIGMIARRRSFKS
ncbi:MAG TPA: FxDxF family PEP-CTERM protein, partial [Phycisphaerae bacterium]|nr:FxDxF family PEP-CTERM protein [Phycisphaerae bacterium]